MVCRGSLVNGVVNMKTITVLGATGSIGMSTLDVVARHAQRYQVFALTANRQVERMLELCRNFTPRYAVMADEDAATQLEQQLRQCGAETTEVLAGVGGLEFVSSHKEVDYVMAAIVGAAGLLPALAAARSGKRVLLANKEALVMSGQLFMDEIKSSGAELLPIDSEHNAIFQCMPADFIDLERNGVRRILLTASGGPFRTLDMTGLKNVTPAQAVAHPNWDMGRKISVDSASMMNKGLEVIEARWLFDASADQIDVVVHPQSVIHSMVEYADGSVLAQMGNPDMRTPIAHAMAWPERIDSGVASLNLFEVARLDFEKPDLERFPCLGLAYQALREGGTATAILNAANEVAVDAFLDDRIGFLSIAETIEATLTELPAQAATSLDVIMQADLQAREIAQRLVTAKGG